MTVSLFGDLPAAVVVLLLLSACVTSTLTASLGAGGGIMLLAIMAQVLPPAVIIPVHGVVQLGSNGGRALMSWRHIDWRTLGAFLPGAVIGALLGSLVLVNLPPQTMYLSIAGFILYLCWGPPLPKLVLGRPGIALAGGATTFVSLFVGATGALVGAFIKQIHADRFTTVATFSAAMSFQHATKAVVFQEAGFDLTAMLPLIIAMIASGAIGTWIGLHLLKRMQDAHFARLFNLVLTALALRLIWQALTV
ncbi:MAG: sulfite exporter TauE/SafE family protein [Proteobacteria bacterium]|nr:MAG: sulfite exporter TauE/SafE family protein [Pseudomonadota bacterium]